MRHLEINIPGSVSAMLEAFLLTDELTFGQEKNRPAVIVCPGGGYVYRCPREAEPVAVKYASEGYHAFVLHYSVAREATGFAPLKELSWAIGYLRANWEEWNLDPEKIAVCGFSAGGHLALASGVMGEEKPNAMILGYPAVSAPNMPGMDFMLKILTGKDAVCDEDAQEFELLSKITKDAPPVFLAATAEDMLTAYGALPVANAYSALGKPYELHVFQHGPHGYALANTASANGSSVQLNDAFAQWHGLSVAWLKKIFGQPEFVPNNVSMMMHYLKEFGYIPKDDPRGKVLEKMDEK